MKRPVTLFTGQWADLTLEEVCKKAAAFGYDGLELACWGDHIEVECQTGLAEEIQPEVIFNFYAPCWSGRLRQPGYSSPWNAF